MKKYLIPVIIAALVLTGAYKTYNYFNGPKMIEGVISRSVAESGKPLSPASQFSPEDTVYFSAKGKKFLTKKADVVWYEGKVATENRFLVEEDIDINEEGYFTAKLEVPEGLEKGRYSVSIYNADDDIIQLHREFIVK